MYITLNETKINIESEVHDHNILSMTIKSDLGIDVIYNAFASSDLSEIKLYSDDDTLVGVFTGYTTIETFYYTPSTKTSLINLLKYKVEDIKTGLDQCLSEVNLVKEKVSDIQNRNLTKQSEYALSLFAVSLTDEQALGCVLLFPEWDPNGKDYKTGDRFRYNEEFYKVLQDHKSQSNWTPDTATSLYVEISDPNIEWPEWKQPTGAHDAYNKNDKVSHEGKHYISLIDANTTVPGSDPRWWELVEV